MSFFLGGYSKWSVNGFIVDDGLDVLGHMIVVKVGGLAASMIVAVWGIPVE